MRESKKDLRYEDLPSIPGFLRVTQVRKLMQVSRPTLDAYIRQGKIRAFGMSQHLRIDPRMLYEDLTKSLVTGTEDDASLRAELMDEARTLSEA